MTRGPAAVALALTVSSCGGGPSPSPTPAPVSSSWSVARSGAIVEIGYGSGSDFPQYAALHTDSGYFRMNYGRTSGWGTSVVLPPSFWAGGTYHQGTPVTASWTASGSALIVSFSGALSSLQFAGEIRLSPPTSSSITAAVTMEVSGTVTLEARPGEAFKPVMLSSMHVSDSQWDARSVTIDSQTFPIPVAGWIVQPPARGRVFALIGGSSAWKANAPTIEVTLTESRDITGWVTAGADPNADNVGLWAAADAVLRSWRYTVTARPQ